MNVESNRGIAVVIPAYRVASRVLGVISRIGPEVDAIYVVDDCCPEGSGSVVRTHCKDPRVTVIVHAENQGVGGAVMSGYLAALEDNVHVVVKVDGDGQMDPALIPSFARPILEGWADYAKGNRFFDLDGVRSMPTVRLIGNAVLSLMAKASTGYWNVFDPTNGYTAIDARLLERLPLKRISKRYFFETDMLFRLNTLRCVVLDIPMSAVYGGEQSSLRVRQVVFEFALKHVSNMFKRIFYSYFLRDMSIASIQLVVGACFLVFGAAFAAITWFSVAQRGVAAPVGTIMIAALSILIGVQLLLAFAAADMASVPSQPAGRLFGRGPR
jgi:glycosyltransferase involved in cell wall biosynthesis